MKITGNTILLAIIVGLVLLVGIVSADSEYCTPPENLTTTVDNQGTWFNITINSNDCLVWTDDGYGNITSTTCDNDPPASITNLANVTTTCEEITWSWDEPLDADYDYLYAMKNGTWFGNYSNASSQATWAGLGGGVVYEISTHTVDVYGNMNMTWVNMTANTSICAVTPVADFSANDTSVCEYDVIQFTDESLNTPTNWFWLFGDSQDSHIQDPTHFYDTAGVYNVSLKSGNDAGDDTETKTNYITVNDCTPPDTIEKLTHTQDCYNITWNWIDPTDPDFDHVEIYQNDTFLHNIAAGVETDTWTGLTQNLSYNFSSRTVDASGNKDTDWVNHTVSTDTCYFMPVIDFVGTPLEVCIGQNVTFTDLSTGSPTAWLWAFGDGNTSPLQNPSKNWSYAQLFNVSLKAGNPAGDNSTQKLDYVNVTDCTPPAIASFTSNATCGIVPFNIQFTDTSTGGNITNWSWTFGDGNSSFAQHPNHTYSSTGIYSINFSVTNPIGISWANASGYLTARFPGDTCAGTVGTGEVYDTDKYQPNWFTGWWG